MTTSGSEQRVLVCGGRDYWNKERAFEWLDSLRLRPYNDLIINGGAAGADQLARQYCASRCIPCLVVPAAWDVQGKGAGPFRNRVMLQWKPTLVLAFPGGAGTANMKWLARGKGVQVIEVPE